MERIDNERSIRSNLKILICGISGSGKTTLARELAYHFLIPHHNADTYREYTKNNEFTLSARNKQATIMAKQWGILDFISPTDWLRDIVRPDYIIYMNTVESSMYVDTDSLFEPPQLREDDIEIKAWIDGKKLRQSLEGFNPGIEGIRNYLKEQLPKLVK